MSIRRALRTLIIFSVLAVAGAVASPAVRAAETPRFGPDSAIFTVNDLSDNGDINIGNGICDADAAAGTQCTLRAALQEANATAALDTIRFQFSGSGPWTLFPFTPYPEITAPVTLDAVSGNGSCATASTPPDVNVIITGIFITRADVGGANFAAFNLQEGSDGSTVQGFSLGFFGNDLNPPNELLGAAVRMDSTDNVVRCNYLGVSRDGVTAFGNRWGAIANSDNNTVGGTNVSDRNIIGANYASGVQFDGSADSNIVYNNYIGTTADGTGDLGNDAHGVNILGGDDHIVGTVNEGNIIAFNRLDGVSVDPLSLGTIIRANSIFANDGLGIDLGQDGLTLNDPLDSDTGANDLQNFPVIESADDLGNIDGMVSSRPNIFLTIDFYRNSTCDDSEHGEGETYLGNTTLNTGPGGDAFFAVNLPGFGLGDYLTATATDILGNTSEFSECFLLTADEIVVNSAEDDADLDPGNGVCDSSTDAGLQCTLRAAIEEVNAAPAGPVDVRFDIPGTGVQVIQPQTALPVITTPIIIRGASQPEAYCPSVGGPGPANLLIALDGVNLASGNGLELAPTATGSEIRGLAIGRFPDDGIQVDAVLVSILCNHIGIGTDGLTDRGNGVHGVHVTNELVTIGGSDSRTRNVISGNGSNGIYFSDAGNNGLVRGNYIGTDADGLIDVGNTLTGVRLNAVYGNYIGGLDRPERNVISGNDEHGINIRAESFINLVFGNYVGTDRTGSVALGNGQYGLMLRNSFENFIGANIDDGANVFSGNGSSGIYVYQSEFSNYINDNIIGLDADRAAVIANGGAGVRVEESNNTRVNNNTISGNSGHGVTVVGTTSINNHIYANAIYDNGLLGINLGADGVKANDPGDGDTGPNNFQNFPVLTAATGALRVDGTLNSLPSATYTLDFYANAACDGSGNGEGEVYVGSAEVTTDGAGDVAFSVEFVTDAGPFITATATDADGNTSEFSACVEAADDDLVYVSPDTFGTTDDGVAYEPGDILRYEVTLDRWTVFFDGSAHGIGSNNIDAIHILPNGNIAMSFADQTNVPGAGLRDDSDLVLFNVTTELFSFVFDGSDVGVDLTTDDEDVVSLSATPAFEVVMSTAGPYSVTGLPGGVGGDLLEFSSPTWGPVTSGTWLMYFANAFAIDGLWFETATIAYVSFPGPLAGYDDNDIVRCVAGNCDAVPFFDGDSAGLNAGVEALHLDLADAALAGPVPAGFLGTR